jgi:ribosomal-protein-alanine N-acetyltransferase
VFLEVRSDNASAMAMYLAHGFEQLNVRRDYYAPGVDAVVMRLMVKHE